MNNWIYFIFIQKSAIIVKKGSVDMKILTEMQYFWLGIA